jgi:putative two-component system response regulator
MLKGAHGELSEIIKNTCRWHHEWHSGGGYWGVKASELPAYIPIISICDVYCALIFERVYKKAWRTEDALGYIQNQAGTQFCPALVKTFCSFLRGD